MPNTRSKATPKADESRPLTLPAADADPSNMGDVRLLKAAIACTPDPLKPGRAIPDTRFAEDVAKCNDRTLRRYLAGARPLQALLREKCEEIVRAAAKKSGRVKATA